jgi:hypothetical protein
MRPLPNYNFAMLDTYPKSLKAIEEQIQELRLIVSECEFPLSDEDKNQFLDNIKWLKRFYESAERNILDGN